MFSLNLRYGLTLLRKDPLQFFKELKIDFKKDFVDKSENLTDYVWCIALPKSGSTVIEKVFDFLPYVQANKSIFRKYEISKIRKDDLIDINTFGVFPKNKKTFIKTHTPLSTEFFEIRNNFSPKVILLTRDLGDMMLSRYFHILSDKNHWQHNKIINLDIDNGFLESCFFHEKNSNFYNTHIPPLSYYNNWLNDWNNYKSDNILRLNFEEFVKDKNKFIKKILNHLGLLNTKYLKNILEMMNKKNKEENLIENLRKFGRNVSTYRSGKVGDFDRILKNKTKLTFKNFINNHL